MYDTIMTDLVDTILAPPGKAQDALVFAYGQTGTGKTHTMLGPDASLSRAAPANGCIDEDWGCFPRVVYNVWDRLKSSEQPFVLSISAAEFYLMTGGDLLADNKPIVASLQTGEPLGLKQVILQEPSQVLDVLAVIRKNRHTRSTKMNQSKGDHQGSSRGHASILLRVSRIETESGVLIETALNLIDLAGAERPSKIGVKRMSGYDAMIEIMNNPEKVSTDAQASLINFELHLLGTEVVTATQAHKTGSKPYKPQGLLNSVGMCALGSSLTGRAKIAIVVTLSQAEDCGWETWFSCQFGTNLSKLMTPRLLRQPSPVRVVVKGSIETLVDLRKNLAIKTVGDKYRFKRECTAQHELERLLVLRELLNTILPKEDLDKLFAPLQALEQNEEGKN
ncbi:Kinesin-like protein KIF6 [Hondaea fermentalgiana]|uniref:Kinesin-like protein KIF6 n=1 Tax=Hondaea fermentalgiana TaxID=2315210 RepID=A0A2R5G7F3_9STRA|nr:Kinesin-like protein KIF6 [Hondaea fermentalgiana]|eukprot:GBG25718.1 Kinesin-like protein KIF6 [Hondaea fermentalgiana]